MNEQEKNVMAAPGGAAIPLPRPYTFEGTVYTEVPLGNVGRLTVKTACNIQRLLLKRGKQPIVPEIDLDYLIEVAVRASGKPVEFFKWMRLPELDTVKNHLTGLLFGDAGESDGDEGAADDEPPEDGRRVLRLAAPYEWDGETVREVDLSRVDELTGIDALALKMQMDKMGLGNAVIPALNYSYCCMAAARATGRPVEFFYGMPIAEATNIKNVVSSAVFLT